MLKFLSILLAAAVLAAPAHARRKKAPVLEDNKAYVLYLQGCPICQNALEYINERYLTRPDVVRVDLETEEGRSLLKQCAQKRCRSGCLHRRQAFHGVVDQSSPRF